jgi:hypothetical protein
MIYILICLIFDDTKTLERRRLATIDLENQHDLDFESEIFYSSFVKGKIRYFFNRVFFLLLVLALIVTPIFLVYSFFAYVDAAHDAKHQTIYFCSPKKQTSEPKCFLNYTECANNVTQCLDDFIHFSRFIYNLSSVMNNNYSRMLDYKSINRIET